MFNAKSTNFGFETNFTLAFNNIFAESIRTLKN